MALKLRPTGLGSGIDKDRQDYTVCIGGWAIGRRANFAVVHNGPRDVVWSSAQGKGSLRRREL